MSDTHFSPGRLERWILGRPDGVMLRGVFVAVLALGGAVLAQDFAAMRQAGEDTARTERTEPLPLTRPEPGDQVRPYLPRTIPVAPNRGEPAIPGYDAPLDGEAMGRPMTFRRAAGDVVSAVGRIDVGTATAFRAFLEENGAGVREIVLHSPGGSVRDAIEMSRLVRERELNTRVPDDGYCASACPLVLAGGVARAAGEATWIGLHQVYAVSDPSRTVARRDLDRSISDIQRTVAECQQLLVDMGLDPGVWIRAMETPPDELYVLTPAELAESRFSFTPEAPEPAA